jgi:serine/threonine-protein kinase HipA
MVMGEGKNPGVDHLKALGKEHNLKHAPRILAKVQTAVARWRDHAAEAGVSAKSIKTIADHIRGM